MIIIWKGRGGLVILIAIGAFLAMNAVTVSVYHDNDYFELHRWPKVAALWLAGLVSYLIGTYLNSRNARVLIDKRTGHEVVLRPDHSLFFVRMEYWGAILFVLGVVIALMR